jgi:hypothetical protein
VARSDGVRAFQRVRTQNTPLVEHMFCPPLNPILGPILAIFAMAMVFKAPKLLGFAAQEAVTGARTMLRMAERATCASVMAGGAAGAAAGAAAASSEQAPTIYVDMRNAGVVDGQERQEWDGPSFGAAASRAALPPASAPQIIDGDT